MLVCVGEREIVAEVVGMSVFEGLAEMLIDIDKDGRAEGVGFTEGVTEGDLELVFVLADVGDLEIELEPEIVFDAEGEDFRAYLETSFPKIPSSV